MKIGIVSLVNQAMDLGNVIFHPLDGNRSGFIDHYPCRARLAVQWSSDAADIAHQVAPIAAQESGMGMGAKYLIEAPTMHAVEKLLPTPLGHIGLDAG